ncbi:zinc finger protein, putative [Ricinus communis]|uniref:Zinc finger protein, putative n=1 Tax=Ricinus communis TaxID=3988 RepID=B9S7Q4_RICCO|nr:zinc finger protein, putative [Ricinus communis]
MASSSVYTSCLISVLFVLTLETLALQADARAFFAFGDSLVDSGNNNYLATTARPDAPPYGIDYPTHQPTRRFSNGLNIPDLICEQIGSESPFYLDPSLKGQKLLSGANFASAGIGIPNDTGIQFVIKYIRMHRQLEYFQQYQKRVQALIGADQTERLVSEALVLITVGGNDFVNNYYLVPFSARSRQYSLPDYVKYLISEYRKLLMKLYQLGARRVLVTGTGPLGCVPAELAIRGTNGGCSAELQRAASLYNPQLVEMLNEVNGKIGRDVIIGVNTQQMNLDFVNDPEAFGFTKSKIACCGQGPYNGIGLCTSLSNLCPNHNLYAFLGSIPSIRKGKQNHYATDYDRLHSVHEPHEFEQHPGLGCQDLMRNIPS